MKNRRFVAVVAVVLAAAVCSGDAFAWGPRAQRAITGTSIQVVSRSIKDAYKTTSANYEEDVLKGALAGPSALRDAVGLNNDARVIHRIEAEMQLLNYVRSSATGSYYAYRIGVLSSLISDLYLPYMWDTSREGRKLAAQINTEIDEHLDNFTYVPLREKPLIIRELRAYLDSSRRYMPDAALMIQADYSRGEGYEGYLRNGGAQNAFNAAVQASSDITYTIMQTEQAMGYLKPSDETLTWFFVDNIEYMLKEKKNAKAADTAYSHFTRVNKGIYSAYEQIGDMYYEFGNKDRAVEEWKTALESRGSDRPRIVRKIANYYIEKGNELAESVSNPDAPSNALQQALVFFERAMEIDRGNETAARAIQETRVEQKRRDEREQTDREIVSAGETALAEAGTLMGQQKYGEALTVYQKAMALFNNVSSEFKAQRERAEAGKKDAQGNIRKAVTEIIQQGQSLIEEADRTMEEATKEEDFETAKRTYQKAQAVLKYVPDSQSAAHVASRDENIARAKNKFDQVDAEKAKWVEDQERRKKMEEDRRAAEQAAALAGAAAAPTAPVAPAP
ncbi:MAG TPA: hypothetical protein PLD73_12360 [Candidatus Hydrogenedentes bacterium]|jgi:hypothetical protein|nr:hypothetical protein [Candidatus Hydrogenedentota bacterium]